MRMHAFRTERPTRKPWRVVIDGCTLSVNFHHYEDAQRFMIRTTRLALRSSFEIVALRDRSAKPDERRHYDQELRRRSDMAKYLVQQAAIAAASQGPHEAISG